MTELAHFQAAERTLAQIATVPDALDLIGAAEAARVLAERMRLGTASVNHATIISLQPAQWWEWVLILHRDHHRACRRAREFPVHVARLEAALQRHKLHVPTLFGDEQLWRPAEGA